MIATLHLISYVLVLSFPIGVAPSTSKAMPKSRGHFTVLFSSLVSRLSSLVSRSLSPIQSVLLTSIHPALTE